MSEEEYKIGTFITVKETNWQLTAHIYRYFEIIDKLHKEKVITKERHAWLTKKRPFELMKELIDKRAKQEGNI